MKFFFTPPKMFEDRVIIDNDEWVSRDAWVVLDSYREEHL